MLVKCLLAASLNLHTVPEGTSLCWTPPELISPITGENTTRNSECTQRSPAAHKLFKGKAVSICLSSSQFFTVPSHSRHSSQDWMDVTWKVRELTLTEQLVKLCDLWTNQLAFQRLIFIPCKMRRLDSQLVEEEMCVTGEKKILNCFCNIHHRK